MIKEVIYEGEGDYEGEESEYSSPSRDADWEASLEWFIHAKTRV